ncbi:uncharacterized protein LOC125592714 [Brassica napus]|uniref:uncharacterized protein LOC125592714 n=1 Tax=Brassica napus TaxID=3708 RepID=UPI0020799A83|nr:uncharacterized protein LOC125592714 [Brassica napus]
MKNSEARPVGTAPLPEANEVEKKNPNECNYIQNDKRSHGKGRGGYRTVTITRTAEIDTWPAGKETTITVVVVPIPAVAEVVMDEVEAESIKDKNPEAHMVHDSGYEVDRESDVANDDLMDFETYDCLKD